MIQAVTSYLLGNSQGTLRIVSRPKAIIDSIKVRASVEGGEGMRKVVALSSYAHDILPQVRTSTLQPLDSSYIAYVLWAYQRGSNGTCLRHP